MTVSVCVCVCVFVHACACVHVCMCACMRACVYMRAGVRAGVHDGCFFARRSVFRNLTKHLQLTLLGGSLSFGLGDSLATGSVIEIYMSPNVR